jgi:hypothetical protein
MGAVNTTVDGSSHDRPSACRELPFWARFFHDLPKLDTVKQGICFSPWIFDVGHDAAERATGPTATRCATIWSYGAPTLSRMVAAMVCGVQVPK